MLAPTTFEELAFHDLVKNRRQVSVGPHRLLISKCDFGCWATTKYHVHFFSTCIEKLVQRNIYGKQYGVPLVYLFFPGLTVPGLPLDDPTAADDMVDFFKILGIRYFVTRSFVAYVAVPAVNRIAWIDF